jgi:hypothetical protein
LLWVMRWLRRRRPSRVAVKRRPAAVFWLTTVTPDLLDDMHDGTRGGSAYLTATSTTLTTTRAKATNR